MTRITVVKKSRKEVRCGKCGTDLLKGSTYRHWAFRYGGKRVRCMEVACNPRPSDLTGNDKLQRVYGAREEIEDALQVFRDKMNVEELTSAIESALDAVDEVKDEYQEAADNIRSSFSESETADQCEEKANNLEEAADDIRTAIEDLLPFEKEKEDDEDLIEDDWVNNVVDSIEPHLDNLEPER